MEDKEKTLARLRRLRNAHEAERKFFESLGSSSGQVRTSHEEWDALFEAAVQEAILAGATDVEIHEAMA